MPVSAVGYDQAGEAMSSGLVSRASEAQRRHATRRRADRYALRSERLAQSDVIDFTTALGEPPTALVSLATDTEPEPIHPSHDEEGA
jgi:hypothetical protein